MSQTGKKHKPLSIAEKQNTIKEVDGIPNIAGTNITEELGIPVRNITNKMLGSSDTGQKEFRPLKIALIWHKGKGNPITGLNRPRGFQQVEAPRFQDNRHMKVARLSALRTDRFLPPGNIPGTHFC